jgi:hypothetical protein
MILFFFENTKSLSINMKICQKAKPIDIFIIDIFIHIIILLSILLTFFIFVISKLEKKELTQQIKNQIDVNMPKLYNNIKGFKKALQPLNSENPSIFQTMEKFYDEPDTTTEYWNNTSIIGTIIILLALICGFIAIWFILKYSCNKCIPLGKIIIENIILFGFIGVIEILFFKFIASQYVAVEPSYFVDQTLNSLKKKFSS